MITVIYSYENSAREEFLFAHRQIKSPRGSNRTNEYKALRELLWSDNVRRIRSKFCYNEADANFALNFLKKGEHCYS